MTGLFYKLFYWSVSVMRRDYISHVGAIIIGFVILIGVSLLNEEKISDASHQDLSIRTSVAKGVTQETSGDNTTENASLLNEVLLDVPLINQMDSPRLYNGCEVTSLAMILNFWGIEVSKNELANRIKHVPLKYDDGNNGNPNEGFVGNMEDGPGLGVYHKPIFDLAQIYAKHKLENLTDKPFSSVLTKVSQGLPVWVITTTTFSPISNFESWTTPQGSIDITFKMHSVVITGYNQDSIFINDPYGTKNKQVARESFVKAWEQMGSQAIVLNGV
jgi:uncharacterized protein YvpB